MRHLLSIIGIVAIVSPVAAQESWCDNQTRLQRVNGAAFVLWQNGTGDVLIDAGSIGSGIPGRVFWNPQSDEKLALIVNADKSSIEVDRNGTTTTYTRCK